MDRETDKVKDEMRMRKGMKRRIRIKKRTRTGLNNKAFSA